MLLLSYIAFEFIWPLFEYRQTSNINKREIYETTNLFCCYLIFVFVVYVMVRVSPLTINGWFSTFYYRRSVEITQTQSKGASATRMIERNSIFGHLRKMFDYPSHWDIGLIIVSSSRVQFIRVSYFVYSLAAVAKEKSINFVCVCVFADAFCRRLRCSAINSFTKLKSFPTKSIVNWIDLFARWQKCWQENLFVVYLRWGFATRSPLDIIRALFRLNLIEIWVCVACEIWDVADDNRHTKIETANQV